MPTSTVAIVPLRSPGIGKTRLADVLAPEERALLAQAMLTDVVGALRGAEVDRVVVAAGGPRAASVATSLGVEVVVDVCAHTGDDPSAHTGDLDEVLRVAAATVTDPSDDVLVVPADLPRLTSADVRAVLASAADVVLAPTSGGGTGALLRRHTGRIATAYGPGSADRHRRLAIAAERSVETIERAGFRHDVDTIDDLVALRDVEVGAATAQLLPSLLARRAG